MRYVERKRKQQAKHCAPPRLFGPVRTTAVLSDGPGQAPGTTPLRPPPSLQAQFWAPRSKGTWRGVDASAPPNLPLWPWSPRTGPSLHPSQDSLSSGTTVTFDTGVERGSSMLTPPEERPAGEKEPRRLKDGGGRTSVRSNFWSTSGLEGYAWSPFY